MSKFNYCVAAIAGLLSFLALGSGATAEQNACSAPLAGAAAAAAIDPAYTEGVRLRDKVMPAQTNQQQPWSARNSLTRNSVADYLRVASRPSYSNATRGVSPIPGCVFPSGFFDSHLPGLITQPVRDIYIIRGQYSPDIIDGQILPAKLFPSEKRDLENRNHCRRPKWGNR
jgi:hypothetical protein